MNAIHDSSKEQYKKILEMDDSVRFVGRIQDKRVTAFIRRDSVEPLLNEEMGDMAHYQASLKASMEEMFDGPLGKTNWMITSKENVKLITLFLDEGLLILSIDSDGDHDKIIRNVQSINANL